MAHNLHCTNRKHSRVRRIEGQHHLLVVMVMVKVSFSLTPMNLVHVDLCCLWNTKRNDLYEFLSQSHTHNHNTTVVAITNLLWNSTHTHIIFKSPVTHNTERDSVLLAPSPNGWHTHTHIASGVTSWVVILVARVAVAKYTTAAIELAIVYYSRQKCKMNNTRRKWCVLAQHTAAAASKKVRMYASSNCLQASKFV